MKNRNTADMAVILYIGVLVLVFLGMGSAGRNARVLAQPAYESVAAASSPHAPAFGEK